MYFRVTVVHIPSHIYHMTFEVMKNAMQATIENNWDNLQKLPPIKVKHFEKRPGSWPCVAGVGLPIWHGHHNQSERPGWWGGQGDRREDVPVLVHHLASTQSHCRISSSLWLWLRPTSLKALCQVLNFSERCGHWSYLFPSGISRATSRRPPMRITELTSTFMSRPLPKNLWVDFLEPKTHIWLD